MTTLARRTFPLDIRVGAVKRLHPISLQTPGRYPIGEDASRTFRHPREGEQNGHKHDDRKIALLHSPEGNVVVVVYLQDNASDGERHQELSFFLQPNFGVLMASRKRVTTSFLGFFLISERTRQRFAKKYLRCIIEKQQQEQELPVRARPLFVSRLEFRWQFVTIGRKPPSRSDRYISSSFYFLSLLREPMK